MSLPILIGDPDREETGLARGVLDRAGIGYRFSVGNADGLDGEMPQLVFGLLDVIGLNRIRLLAYNKMHGMSYVFS